MASGIHFENYMTLFVLTVIGWLARGHGDESVNRLNYGVNFQYLGQSAAVNEMWLQTYSITLATIQDLSFGAQIPNEHLDNEARMILVLQCPNKNGGGSANWLECNLWEGNEKYLEQIFGDSHERLTKLLTAIHSLIPKYKLESQKRVTKALLNFGGSILKGLFNTATMDDVKALQAHILQMAKLQDSQTKVLQKSSAHMTSFVSTSIARIDGLEETVRTSINLMKSVESGCTTSFEISQKHHVINNGSTTAIGNLEK